MSFYHIKDVRSTLLPIILISWFVGMGVIEYPVGHKRTMLSSLYSSTLCTFHAICVIFANFNNMVQVKLHVDHRLVNFMYGTYCALSSVVVSVVIVVSIVRNKKRSCCVTELEDVNGIMTRMGVVHSYKRFLTSQIWRLGILVLTIIIIVIHEFSAVMQTLEAVEKLSLFSRIFIMQYACLISTVNEIIFCNFTEMITMFFEDLNTLLESLRVKHSYDSQNTENNLVQVDVFLKDERKREILYSVRKMYTRLSRVAEDWNRINAAANLTSTVFSTWILTLQFYTMYIILSLHGIRAFTDIHFIQPLWIAFFFSCRLFMLVRSAVSLTTEAHRTCGIALHLYPITSLRSEVRTFSMQLIQNPLQLTLHGLCSLDYSMLQQIFVTVAMYLIMVVQNMGVPDFGTTKQ